MLCHILLLSASFGGGHNAAAAALQSRLGERFPNLQIMTIDLFEWTTPRLKRPLSLTYDAITRSNLPIYEPLYKIRNSSLLNMDELITPIFYKRFATQMHTLEPQVVISVFPTCAQFVDYFKHKQCNKLHTVTVITDVIAADEWLHEGNDLYCIPHESLEEEMSVKGVQRDSMVVTGVPVALKFVQVGLDRNHKLITNLRFIGQKPRVLIVSSAMGNIQIDEVFLNKLGYLEADFTIITGKDKALYASLSVYPCPSNVQIFGFVNNIEEHMHQADLIVTKAGGATLFESIAAQLPLLVLATDVGQEAANVNFVEQMGIGLTFKTNGEMIRAIEVLISDARILFDMRHNMQKIISGQHMEILLDQIDKWLHGEPRVVYNHDTMKEKKSEGRNLFQAIKARRITNSK